MNGIELEDNESHDGRNSDHMRDLMEETNSGGRNEHGGLTKDPYARQTRSSHGTPRLLGRHCRDTSTQPIDSAGTSLYCTKE